MKLATALVDGKQKLIVFCNDKTIDVAKMAATADCAYLKPGMCESMLDLIDAGPDALRDIQKLLDEGAGEKAVIDGDYKLLAPIPHPRKNVISVGRNYASHMKEIQENDHKGVSASLRVRPERPAFLTQPWTAITGPDTAIEYNSDQTNDVDYEGELAVIIGKQGKNITVDDAMDYVFGYSIMNDVSARNIQFAHNLPFKGKSLDTFMPFGPCIVTKDEIADPQDVHITTYVNDELRQDGSTEDMIFDVKQLIYYLSMGMTIHPGDIISTGTPKGVGMTFDPPKYLKDGDVVTITLDGIGTLRNTVKEVK